MCSTSVFTSVMKMVPNFAIGFIISVFMFELFLQVQKIFVFSYDSCCSFVNGIIFVFSELIVFFASSPKDSQNFFIQSSPLYKSFLFSIPSNVHVVDTEYPQGICSPTIVGNDFSELFLHPSIF